MNPNTINLLLTICLLSHTSLSYTEELRDDREPDGWAASVLLGVAAAPTYLGDDDLQSTMLPDFRIEYADRFFASLLEGIGYNVIRTEHWRVGPIVKYDFGRDEAEGNPLVIFGDDPVDLIGLGDIEGTVEAGAFLAYETDHWQTKLEIRQDVGDGHDGLVAHFEAKLTGWVTIFGKPSFYSLGPEVVYGDESYNQSYFGITPEQSQASGLAPFVADSGLVSYGIHANLFRPISESWSLGAFGGFDKLGSDAADSSLIVERGDENQFLAGAFLSYRF